MVGRLEKEITNLRTQFSEKEASLNSQIEESKRQHDELQRESEKYALKCKDLEWQLNREKTQS